MACTHSPANPAHSSGKSKLHTDGNFFLFHFLSFSRSLFRNIYRDFKHMISKCLVILMTLIFSVMNRCNFTTQMMCRAMLWLSMLASYEFIRAPAMRWHIRKLKFKIQHSLINVRESRFGDIEIFRFSIAMRHTSTFGCCSLVVVFFLHSLICYTLFDACQKY